MNGWLRDLLGLPDIERALSRIERKLAEADGKLNYLTRRTKIMDDILRELEALNQKVTVLDSVQDSAVELLTGLKKALDDALGLGKAEQIAAAVRAISDKLGSETEQLAAAVAANTPVEPPPVEPAPAP